MPTAMRKAAPTYLREARLAAGYANRDMASAEVPYSPETIGRHERGEVPLSPEDAVIYARHYKREDILIQHCAYCPVGQTKGWSITYRDIPYATLRLTRRIRTCAAHLAETLEAIADNGAIHETERAAFEHSLEALKELSQTIADFLLCAALQGIEKSRLAATPSTQGYSITSAMPRQYPKKEDEQE